MRLAEVTQAPAHQRDDTDEGGTLEHVEVRRVHRLDSGEGLVEATGGDQHEHRGEDEREDHQRGLHGVGPAHSQETTDECVSDGRRCTSPQRGFIRHAEGALEQTGTGNDAGSAVDGEEDQDDDGGDDTQQAAIVFETAGEIVRQGQRVTVVLGLHAQPASHEQPVQVGTNRQADGDPDLGQAREVDGTGQAHQQPATHVGGTGRQRGNHATQAATAQNVIGKVFGGAIGGEADQHHCCDVDHEGDR